MLNGKWNILALLGRGCWECSEDCHGSKAFGTVWERRACMMGGEESMHGSTSCSLRASQIRTVSSTEKWTGMSVCSTKNRVTRTAVAVMCRQTVTLLSDNKIIEKERECPSRHCFHPILVHFTQSSETSRGRGDKKSSRNQDLAASNSFFWLCPQWTLQNKRALSPGISRPFRSRHPC